MLHRHRGLPDGWLAIVEEYRELSAIIVYPSSMLSREVRAGPDRGTATDGDLPILGEACDRRGPVLIAWDEAEAAARNLGNGHNVVLHELAHKLDMANGLLNGTSDVGGHHEDQAVDSVAERGRAPN